MKKDAHTVRKTTPKKTDDKPRTVVMDKEKGEPVVVIKEEESKETKEMAPSERAKSITSSHSKSEPKKEEKKDVLSLIRSRRKGRESDCDRGSVE